ncbi:hypothetical protein A3850_007865 [Lewinella sp. 4G2]|nr:hypothetical protein A3850_007865 [Lewinella sp. 4G2]
MFRSVTHARLWFFYVANLLLATTNLSGQLYDGTNATLSKYSLEDGVPGRIVHTTVRDTNGIIWLGAANRIIRYDGYQFEAIPGISETFSGNFTLGEDGLIYAPHPTVLDSVEIFDPYALRSYGLRLSNLHRGNIQTVRTGHQTPFTYVAGDSIFQLRYASHERTDAASAPFTPFPLHLLPSPLEQETDRLIYANQDQWICRREQRIIWQKNGREKSIGLPASSINQLRLLRTGELWCLTDTTTFRTTFQEAQFREIPSTTLPRARYNHLAEDEVGNVLIGYIEAYNLRAERWHLILQTSNHDLKWIEKLDDRILGAYGRDFSKCIDLASYGGLNLIDFGTSRTRNFKKYFYDPNVTKSKFGHVMRGFTTSPDGITYVNKDSAMDAWYTLKPGASKVDTLPIRDERGHIIDQFGCGTNMLNYRGYVYGHSCFRSPDSTRAHLYRYDPATDDWRVFTAPDLQQVFRYAVLDSNRNCIWLPAEHTGGGAGGRIYRFDLDTETISEYPVKSGRSSLNGYPRDAILSADGSRLWIGSIDGLYEFDIATLHLSRHRIGGNVPTRILDIHPESSARLLLGTLDAGIWAFDVDTKQFSEIGALVESNEVRSENTFIPLPNNSVAGIMGSLDTGLVITTFNGLVYYRDGFTRTFTTREGLGDNEFNSSSLHYDRGTDTWYAGGINGFVSFSSQDLQRQESPYYPVLLRYRLLDGDRGKKEVIQPLAAEGGLLNISPSTVYFTLEYTVPDYRKGRELQYETRLVGLDPDWRTATTTPNVRYTRLPPGEYEFQYRATDADGNIASARNSLFITVERAWYEKPGFYLAVGLLLAGIATIIVRSRFSRLKERYEASRKVQALELRTLRQQMNPHFISNAMNAIREFVYQEDTDRAADYLTDFSRLMRLFLEASRSPMTTIENEVDLISLYVRLEQLRFPGKFTFALTVDENIERDMDEIPSFLLQPIIENAINHGLHPRDRGGELRLSFQLDAEDDDRITIVVSDNGIGRDAAQRRTSDKRHTSRAMEIINDRKNLLSENEDLLFTMETSDLYPGQEFPGTRVTIVIASRPVH